MHKFVKRLVICLMVAIVFWTLGLIADRKFLSDNLIRLHVVANSDSSADQNIKLRIKDAVLESIQSDLQEVTDISHAKEYLQGNLAKIQNIVVKTLEELGVQESAIVTFGREAFDIRHYETFSLPAGVYHSLRIVIGDGLGKNWWCVAFPTLCLPATADDFHIVAADAGMSANLSATLSDRNNHQFRFYFLEKLGHLQCSVLDGK